MIICSCCLSKKPQRLQVMIFLDGHILPVILCSARDKHQTLSGCVVLLIIINTNQGLLQVFSCSPIYMLVPSCWSKYMQGAQWQSGNWWYSVFARITLIFQDFISSAALKFFGLKSFFSESIFVVNIAAFPINGHGRFVLSEVHQWTDFGKEGNSFTNREATNCALSVISMFSLKLQK